MGLGPPVLELYRQLKLRGALDGVAEVMELGSQDFWCPQSNLVRALCIAFDRPAPGPELLNTNNVQQQPARLLYEALGIKYHCVDVDGRVGTLVLDLNFGTTPEEHKGKYGLVTNHGTSEHLLNQFNVFKMMHEFARPGGVMVHAVPFTVHLEHGFFNYQPNFFECLARYNSYETLGIWVGPDWSLASFIPWDPGLLHFLTLNAKTTHLLVVAQRKMYDLEFCVPFQEQYENMVPDEARARYAMVIDGELMDGKRVKYLTKDAILAKEYLSEIQGLKNWIDAYKGQIDGLQNDLATTKFRFSQAQAEIMTLTDQANVHKGRVEDLQRQLATTEARFSQAQAEIEKLHKRPTLQNTSARALANELEFRVRRRLTRVLRLSRA